MIVWYRAVELASYPSWWHKDVSVQFLQPRAPLLQQKGCSMNYDPYSYEMTGRSV